MLKSNRDSEHGETNDTKEQTDYDFVKQQTVTREHFRFCFREERRKKKDREGKK